MSSKRDLKKPHRCIFAKCKGTLVDPINSYGRYAYWWGEDSRGWHSTPEPLPAQEGDAE